MEPAQTNIANLVEEDEAPFRAAPHNIEAEQALLGAVLVNNDACDRVSGFLQANHFFDPLHGRIYESALKLISAGKRASPITLKTFFEHEEPLSTDLTVPQYLGRLAATRRRSSMRRTTVARSMTWRYGATSSSSARTW